MIQSDLVQFERRAAVGIISMRRPPINALNADLLDALDAMVLKASRDDATRAIVLTGGDRMFSAGADIREFSSLVDEPAIRAWITRGHRVVACIARTRMPVIAAIEGYCLGGGLELALGCHLRVAADSAQLGLPEIKLGIVPGFGGTQRLPRLIGRGPAISLMLMGEPIDGRQAGELGLIDELVPTGEALSAAIAIAETLSVRSRSAVASILDLVDESGRASLNDGLGLEIEAEIQAIRSDDGRLGIAAFLEKRSARFH